MISSVVAGSPREASLPECNLDSIRSWLKQWSKRNRPKTHLDVEKRFRRILGYRNLWVLKAILDEKHIDEEKEAA